MPAVLLSARLLSERIFEEICDNGIDDNCNGEVDEGCVSCDVECAIFTSVCQSLSTKTVEKAKDVRRIENTENGLVEVVKYGAKILSDPDPMYKRKRKKGDMTGLNIYANALHTIYKAMNNHRLYGSFGFKLPKSEKGDMSERTVSDYETWTYKPQHMDWINNVTGNNLTEYEIDGYLEYILKTCIDRKLC